MYNEGFKKSAKYYIRSIKAIYTEYKERRKFDKKDVVAGELIRNTHSIEKGLCIENPRLSFGKEKLSKMMEYIIYLIDDEKPYYQEVCCMALDAIQQYIDFHKANQAMGGYSEEWISALENFVSSHQISHEGLYGGIQNLSLNDFNFDIEIVENLFNTRHSVRDFSHEDVDIDDLTKALQLAQRAPSACNRQGVRVYVFKGEDLKDWVGAGIGGFAEAVNKYVMITAKKSSYRTDEVNQYIVSASIYAGYLSLTLHLYGLGACIIQRPVTHTSAWENLRTSVGIDRDEQVIMLIGVGKLKNEFKVPISHRLDSRYFIRFV